MTRHRLINCVACAALVLGATALRAEDTPKPVDAPTTKPANPTTKPADAAAPVEANISPAAQKVIAQIGEAYGKLKTLEVTGKLSSDIEAGGDKKSDSGEFTATFSAPNKFRHAMKDDVLCGSTGEKAYSFLHNSYTLADVAKEKVQTSELPAPLPKILKNQDPSLMLALAKDPAGELTGNAISIARVDDTDIGDTSCPTLKISTKDKQIAMLAIDPETHLIRRLSTDIKAVLEKEGVPDVKHASYTVDYTATTADGDAQDKQFAWAPPEGAKEFKGTQGLAADDGPIPGEVLVGHDAPDFKLSSLDGKQVSLSDLKGKVVVLDFWATWCPPCRASLPHLNKLYDEKKAEGVQVFAVNQQEEKDKVQEFVEKTKLTLPILLDTSGDVNDKYKASGAIPETVVIGKDGIVKKVFLGFDPDVTPGALHKAIADAMK
jgi:peroxiredoxin